MSYGLTTGIPVSNQQASIPRWAFLVFYFKARDHIRCDPKGDFLNGSNEAGRLFSSLDDAQSFAGSVFDDQPRLGAGIYDSSWMLVSEYLHDDFVRKQERAQSPSRLFLLGGALLVLGAFFLWLDMRQDWTLILGFLIGSRLILSGILKLAQGVTQARKASS